MTSAQQKTLAPFNEKHNLSLSIGNLKIVSVGSSLPNIGYPNTPARSLSPRVVPSQAGNERELVRRELEMNTSSLTHIMAIYEAL